MLTMVWLSCLTFGVGFSFYFLWYGFAPLSKGARTKEESSQYKRIMFYGLAYMLSILRLPFTFLPYLIKFVLYMLLPFRAESLWQSRYFQLARLAGDFLNYGLGLVVFFSIGEKNPVLLIVLCVVCWAELIRLVTEKGHVLFSNLWQRLPHAHLVPFVEKIPVRIGEYYRQYYQLDSVERLSLLTDYLRSIPISQESRKKLAYFGGFRVIDPDVYLRQGKVRDIPTGEIFIHGQWVNDPWLLIGLALRRTPWFFDPRYLERPFYYRTEANHLATLFVFENTYLSPPFALYQFGHEIKVARYDLFFRLCRRGGIHLEAPIRRDGTYQFDPLIWWFWWKLFPKRKNQGEDEPLWSENRIFEGDFGRENHGSRDLEHLSLAQMYQLPLRYVEEVLIPEVERRTQG